VTLLDLLSNSLILRQTAPYIPWKGLLSLSATCKDFQGLVSTSPEATNYMNLSTLKLATLDSTPIDSGGVSWRAMRMDEALTEDDFYCGPLRGIFSKIRRKNILLNVNTLILDGLTVTADLVREILMEDQFNARILSIRECKHLNQSKLNQVLRYAVRPTRPAGTPKLKALYFFGPKDSESQYDHTSHTSSEPTTTNGVQISSAWNQRSTQTLSSELGQPDDRWYRPTGRVMKQPSMDWPETMKACEGIIAFDAVLCRGPRHDPICGREYLKPAIATIALGPNGCQSCGSCPEQPATFGRNPESLFPLLSPPPLHSSNVKAAQRPFPVSSQSGSGTIMPPLYLRCEDCLRGRWCERCNKWWCENCYGEPVSRDTAMYNLAAGNEIMHSSGAEVHISNESSGRSSGGYAGPVKVYLNLCVESCYHREVWPTIDGNWG